MPKIFIIFLIAALFPLAAYPDNRSVKDLTGEETNYLSTMRYEFRDSNDLMEYVIKNRRLIDDKNNIVNTALLRAYFMRLNQNQVFNSGSGYVSPIQYLSGSLSYEEYCNCYYQFAIRSYAKGNYKAAAETLGKYYSFIQYTGKDTKKDDAGSTATNGKDKQLVAKVNAYFGAKYDRMGVPLKWHKNDPALKNTNLVFDFFGKGDTVFQIMVRDKNSGLCLIKGKNSTFIFDIKDSRLAALEGDDTQGLMIGAWISVGDVEVKDGNLVFKSKDGDVIIKTEEDGTGLTREDIEKFLKSVSDPKLLKEISQVIALINQITEINSELMNILKKDIAGLEVACGRVSGVEGPGEKDLRQIVEEIEAYIAGLKRKDKDKLSAADKKLLEKYNEVSKSASFLTNIYEKDMRTVDYLFIRLRELFGNDQARIVVADKGNVKETIIYLRKQFKPQKYSDRLTEKEKVITELGQKQNINQPLMLELVQ